MAREVIWTAPAEKDRKDILAYWIDRNGSAAYSIKLFERFRSALRTIVANPFIGRPTDLPGIRMKRISGYLLFYEVGSDAIVVHHIWHERRDLKRMGA